MSIFVSRSCDLCGAETAEHLLTKNGASYCRCGSCGFIYTDQCAEDSKAANADYFAATLEQYARKAGSPRKQAAWRRILASLEPHRRLGTLLEVGANVGGFLAAARDQGWKAVGVEPSLPCARFAREQRGLDVRDGVLEEAGLPENAFDVVYANAVFEHLPKPGLVFQEVERILRPGGVVLIDTVNWDSYTRRNVGQEWKLIDPRVHLCLYTPDTLARYCRNAGLEVVRMHSHGVRFRPNHAPPLSGFARIWEEVRKAPWSALSRFTLKGDSIAVLARKPETSGN